MGKINHWCVVCGKGYHACDTCLNEKTFAPWKTFTDSSEHFKIFMILQDYNNKVISKVEAKEKLSNVDTSGWEKFKESSKRLMGEILQEDSVDSVEIKTEIEEKKLIRKNSGINRKNKKSEEID